MGTIDFGDFMAALSRDAAKAEPPIEPCIEQGAKHFAKRKEQAELEQGAVMKVLREEGEADGGSPEEGDLVKFHYTVRKESSPVVLETSGSSEASPPAVFVLGKGCRMPRGLEIGVQSMKKGERSTFTIKPSFGFGHPDCSWRSRAERDAKVEESVLDFDVHLVDFTKSVSVQFVDAGDDSTTATSFDETVIKETIVDGSGWENPRPPYKVKVQVTAREGTEGAVFFDSGGGEGREPLTFSCGACAVPKVLEDAIGLMFQGEVARIYVRAPLETSDLIPTSSSASASAPPGAAGASVLQTYEVALLEVIQVRDVLGTGEVMKTRTAKGRGEFPIDCPIVDCPMRIRCVGKLVPAQGKEGGEVFWDTGEGGFAMETGLNMVPDGLEMCLKLMVPGEVSLVRCAAKYAYDPFPVDDPVGAGVPKGREVEWEVTLIGFDKPKQLADLSVEEAVREAEERKGKANALFKATKYKYAQVKYQELLRELKALVDMGAAILDEEDENEGEGEGEEGGSKGGVGGLVLSCTLNLAACAQRSGDHVEALKHCNKALEMEAGNAKALYRRGQTHCQLSEWDLARSDFRNMAAVSADLASEAENQIARVDKLQREATQKQRKEFQGFFNR